MAITREDYVTQSVDKYLRRLLLERGYTEDTIEILPSFPHTRFDDTPLEKSYVCTGFSFDDGGRDAEMGSNLKERLYTIEFFVIGQDETWAKNLAQAVKFVLGSEKTIPLLDITDPSLPTIDALIVASASAEHQPIASPKPWQEHIWTVHARIEDFYDAGAAIE
jgi:hypothetical protein